MDMKTICSLPFVLQEINVPVYGSAISVAFADNKIERRSKEDKTKFITVENGDVIKTGPFEVEFIRVTHSIEELMLYLYLLLLASCL